LLLIRTLACQESGYQRGPLRLLGIVANKSFYAGEEAGHRRLCCVENLTIGFVAAQHIAAPSGFDALHQSCEFAYRRLQLKALLDGAGLLLVGSLEPSRRRRTSDKSKEPKSHKKEKLTADIRSEGRSYLVHRLPLRG
jgi:hypothetical protein